MAIKNKESQNRTLMFALIKFFHLISAIQFCFAVYYDYAQVNVPPEFLRSKRASFGGKFKYLTFIDGVMSKRTRA